MIDYLSLNFVPIVSLTFMELVLGGDNLVFISIFTSHLPVHQKKIAQQLGLFIAVIPRIILAFFLGFLNKLNNPWFSLFSHEFSIKDVVLMVGGLFLLYKAVGEIHAQVYNKEEHIESKGGTFFRVILSIVGICIIFSIDSMVTAAGMASDVSVMIIALLISSVLMIILVNRLSQIITQYPSVKMLAMSFLVLIGGTLFFEATGSDINKNMIYAMMAFSLCVEALNIVDRHHDRMSDQNLAK